MTVMDFPSSPINGQTTTDGRYYFDSSVGSTGAWRSTPLPVGGLPAGSIIQWSSNTAPANWLICDGAAVSRTVYSSLFAVIGTTYGTGDGSTTFNLPDLRGRVPVGRNGGTFSTLAGTGGAETHTLSVNEMPSHSHNLTKVYGGQLTNDSGSTTPAGMRWETSSITDSGDISSTGGGAAHNNLQPYLVVNYIIKATAGWTAGDSELATRVGALETADATTNKSGLVPIVPTSVSVGSGSATIGANGIVTFSGASTVSMNGCFNANYRIYRIVFSATATTLGPAVYGRLRASGTDATTNNHYYGGIANREGVASVGYWTGAGVGAFDLTRLHSTAERNPVFLEVTNPFQSGQATAVVWNAWANDGSGGIAVFGSGNIDRTDSFDGFSFVSTGTMSGKIQVYGYR